MAFQRILFYLKGSKGHLKQPKRKVWKSESVFVYRILKINCFIDIIGFVVAFLLHIVYPEKLIFAIFP